MTQFLWEENEFYDDLEEVLSDLTVHTINIASAYISLSGAQHLKTLTNELSLKKDAIQIYCSSTFTEQQPAEILSFLATFATVHIIHQPFLHTKAYEIHSKDKVTTYTGSANLTDGGLFNNFELMAKLEGTSAPLQTFWEDLWQKCILVDEEIIQFYQELPIVEAIPRETPTQLKLQNKLKIAYEKQCLESHYPDLTGYYFTVDDYRIFNEEYWESGTTEVKERRKATQQKLYELNEAIEAFAACHDLYPHYHKEHLTSGIVPSDYNFRRVTGIWMRYGKHKSELNPFGTKSFGPKLSPFEQFHKHACLQLAIGSNGISIGMFHSTAKNGVDCHYVDENWYEVKQEILNVYDLIKCHNFIWTFYSNQENKMIDTFEIDAHTAEEFVKFYRKYDMLGYESFCMRFYETNDLRIKTYKTILQEIENTFETMLPLYKAMTYRIPLGQRI